MRVMKYLTVLSFLVVMSFGLYACDDPNNGRTGPRGNMPLSTSWGTHNRDNQDNITARESTLFAKFQHDDHDDRRCTDCHSNDQGGRIDINAKAGDALKDKAHGFCVGCHNGVRDREAPKADNCIGCHKLSNYYGGY